MQDHSNEALLVALSTESNAVSLPHFKGAKGCWLDCHKRRPYFFPNRLNILCKIVHFPPSSFLFFLSQVLSDQRPSHLILSATMRWTTACALISGVLAQLVLAAPMDGGELNNHS